MSILGKKSNDNSKKLQARILIVDDEPEMTEELKAVLEDEGYEVIVAFDGIQAVRCFRKYQFGVVLLDVKMPGMNGVATCRKMRQINEAVPVIIVTGSFAKRNAEQALQEGARTVIYKPFEVEELLSVIRNYV